MEYQTIKINVPITTSALTVTAIYEEQGLTVSSRCFGVNNGIVTDENGEDNCPPIIKEKKDDR